MANVWCQKSAAPLETRIVILIANNTVGRWFWVFERPFAVIQTVDPDEIAKTSTNRASEVIKKP